MNLENLPERLKPVVELAMQALTEGILGLLEKHPDAEILTIDTDIRVKLPDEKKPRKHWADITPASMKTLMQNIGCSFPRNSA